MKSSFILFILFMSISSQTLVSQDFNLGISGGLLNGSGKISENDATATSSDSGFYLGLFTKFKLNNKISILPELNYGNLNDRSFSFLSMRIEYYVVPKLYLQAGPQITYLFDVLTNDIKKAGVDLGFGLGYDLTDNFHIQARYAFEVSNRFKENGTDLTARFNWLHVGVGYSFL